MCEYCEIKDTIMDERYPWLAGKQMDFGALKNFLHLDLVLNKQDHTIECDLVSENLDTIATVTAKINYCPMCGSKL